MRNHIPRVRGWRVRYYINTNAWHGFAYYDVFVDTINKCFARWEARDMARGEPWYRHAVKETVVPHTDWINRS